MKNYDNTNAVPIKGEHLDMYETVYKTRVGRYGHWIIAKIDDKEFKVYVRKDLGLEGEFYFRFHPDKANKEPYYIEIIDSESKCNLGWVNCFLPWMNFR